MEPTKLTKQQAGKLMVAEVTLELEEDEVTPLHEGTRAAVRSAVAAGSARGAHRENRSHSTPGKAVTGGTARYSPA